VRATRIEEEEDLISIYQLYILTYSLVFCFELTRHLNQTLLRTSPLEAKERKIRKCSFK
jgi:hypothetical protein